jgi:predicted aspartyl protease
MCTGTENLMSKRFASLVYSLSGLLLSASVAAENFTISIPMQDKGAATFYVPAEIGGLGTVDFMVDTGSGHTTINEETLASLLQQNNASFVKNLEGILADGSRMVVPVYAIRQMNIGGQCELKNIEVAIFPGKTRQILGLSALRQASPFIFSVNPPELILSNCSAEFMESRPASALPGQSHETAVSETTASPS